VRKIEDLKECTGERIVQSQIGAENVETDFNWNSNIWKSYLIHFFMGFHMISGVLLPFFMTWGELSFIEVMFLQSYFTLMVLAFEIPCGAIADYISRKFSLLLGSLTTGLAALIYGTYPNIMIFVIGETLWAFGAALTSGTDQALIYDTLKKLEKEGDISRIMARIRSFSLLGIATSAPFGSVIGSYLSLNLVMSLMFFPFTIAAGIMLTLKEPNNYLKKEYSENYFSIIKSGFAEFKKNRILRLLAFEMIIIEIPVFFLIWIYQLYLEALNFQLILFGFVSTSITIIQIVFNNILPNLENKYKNKRKFLQIYTVIPGVGFILMSVIFFIPISIPLILLVIGFGFSRSLIFTKGINKEIKTQNRATVISTINMLASLIRALIYPFIGYFVNLNLSITFLFLGTMIIIFTLFSRIKSEYL
jgi:MFS family permease